VIVSAVVYVSQVILIGSPDLKEIPPPSVRQFKNLNAEGVSDLSTPASAPEGQ